MRRERHSRASKRWCLPAETGGKALLEFARAGAFLAQHEAAGMKKTTKGRS